MRWLVAPLMVPLLSGLGLVWGYSQVPPDAKRVEPDGSGVTYRWRGEPCRSGVFAPESGPVDAPFGTVCEGDPWAR